MPYWPKLEEAIEIQYSNSCYKAASLHFSFTAEYAIDIQTREDGRTE